MSCNLVCIGSTLAPSLSSLFYRFKVSFSFYFTEQNGLTLPRNRSHSLKIGGRNSNIKSTIIAFRHSTQCWQPRMALVSGQRSKLNPNAPVFIPAVFRQVEDFSPKWWELVKTSTWFRDYWLSEHEEDDFVANAENVATKEALDRLPESFDLSIEDDYRSLEAEFEDLVFSCESEDKIDPPTTENRGMNHNGSILESKALLKDMLSLSPRHGATKSPGRSAKYFEKPMQHVGVKCSPRRIQQPR